MTPARAAPSRARRGGGRRPPGPGNVISLEAARILAGLQARVRYRYVRPRIEREGEGWKVVSPNCSRNVDRTGGEIDIAWFQPAGAGRWLLHARDHAAQAWRPVAGTTSLAAAVGLLCDDDDRVYWP